MLRCQFLCHVLKALFFIEIALKLSYFCKKMQNLDPQNMPPLRIFGYAPVSAGFLLKSGKKSVSFLGRPFSWSLLICLPEKNRGRGSSPQC